MCLLHLLKHAVCRYCRFPYYVSCAVRTRWPTLIAKQNLDRILQQSVQRQAVSQVVQQVAQVTDPGPVLCRLSQEACCSNPVLAQNGALMKPLAGQTGCQELSDASSASKIWFVSGADQMLGLAVSY